jgi:hypothetical protein
MTVWGRFLNTGILPGTTPEQVSELPGKLRVLAGRLEEVLANLRMDHAPELVNALQDDLRSWRLAIVDVLNALAADPGAPGVADLDHKLRRRLAAMEARLDEVTDALGPDALTEAQAGDFYRLMGSFRGLSEALLDFRELAGHIDWEPWREARFA